MVEEASDIALDAESEDNPNANKAAPQAHQFTPEQFADAISALPVDTIKNRKKKHKKVFTAPSPSLSVSIPPTTSRWNERPWVRKILRRMIPHTTPNRPPHSLVSRRRMYQETLERTIKLEVPDGRGSYTSIKGRVMIDFWCEHNLVSRNFGNRIFDNLDSADSYVIVDSLGGEANAIKKFESRWHCVDDPGIENPCLRFDPTMDLSAFHVMEREYRFDVIIGCADIVKYDLLDIGKRPPFAAPAGFRSLRQSVDSLTARQVDDANRQEREFEEQQRRRDAEYQRRLLEYAETQAHAYALPYARKYATDYGAQYFDQEYKREYDRRHQEAIKHYTQHYPRT